VATSFHVSLDSAQWTLTIALLSGAVATPVMGGLGAGPHRRATILATLAIVVVGSALTALPLPFAWLLVGRRRADVRPRWQPGRRARSRHRRARRPGRVRQLRTGGRGIRECGLPGGAGRAPRRLRARLPHRRRPRLTTEAASATNTTPTPEITRLVSGSPGSHIENAIPPPTLDHDRCSQSPTPLL
jgi:hypothetical protein